MSEIEQTPKYVVQIEHTNPLVEGQNNALSYLIKDAALTQRVTNLEQLLRTYKGWAGIIESETEENSTEASGILSSDWIDNHAESGLYIVISIDNNENFDTGNDRNNSNWTDLQKNDLDKLLQIAKTNQANAALEAIRSDLQTLINRIGTPTTQVQTALDDLETDVDTPLDDLFTIAINNSDNLKYINSDKTAVNTVTCPAILIVNKVTNASTQTTTQINAILIDAQGAVWRREQLQSNTYQWINLWDVKANISDLRQACAIIDLQTQAIETLNNNLKLLQQQVQELESLKDLADILNMSIDVEGNYDNILVIGNDIDFYVENNRYPVQDVVKKYLRTNGTVVWLKANTTIDAIQYVVKYVDDQNNTLYPQFIADMNDNIRFNQIGNINADVFDITKFDSIIILLNRNDLYTTTEYNNEALAKRIGTYNPQNRALPSIRAPEKYAESDYINYIPISLGNSTICVAILALVDTIRSNNSNAKIRIATPITWVPNNSTNMTSVQISAADALVKEIKDNLCPKEGIPFIDTQRIVNTTKDYELSDAGDAVKQNTINAYISEICASINTTAAGGQTVFNLNDTPTKGNFILGYNATAARSAYHDFTITPGFDGNIAVHLKYNRSFTNIQWVNQDAATKNYPHTEFYIQYRTNPSSDWTTLEGIHIAACNKILTNPITCTASDTIYIRAKAYIGNGQWGDTTTGTRVQFNWEVSFSIPEN